MIQFLVRLNIEEINFLKIISPLEELRKLRPRKYK